MILCLQRTYIPFYIRQNSHTHTIPPFSLSLSLIGYSRILSNSYGTLANDFNFLDVEKSRTRKRRKKAKYRHASSPLLKVKWWRVALDETQMVNKTTAKCARTANELEAVNRWCISGTPIMRDFDDLFGLVYFLRLYPYYDEKWWKELVTKPIRSDLEGRGHTVLLRLLGDIFWRTFGHGAKRE